MSAVVRRCRHCGTDALPDEKACSACHQPAIRYYCTGHEDFIDGPSCPSCPRVPAKPKAPPSPRRGIPTHPARPVPAHPPAVPVGATAATVFLLLFETWHALRRMIANVRVLFWIAVAAIPLPERVVLWASGLVLACAISAVALSRSVRWRPGRRLFRAAAWGVAATSLLTVAWMAELPLHYPAKQTLARLRASRGATPSSVAPDSPGPLTTFAVLVGGSAQGLWRLAAGHRHQPAQPRDFELPPLGHGGNIMVTSDPPAAVVVLDGKPQGVTPLQVRADIGDRIRCRLQGYQESGSRTVDAEVLKAETLHFYLAALARSGNLEITSSPSGAIVLLDGSNVGLTPMEIVTYAGSRVQCRLSGYEPSGVRRIDQEALRSGKLDFPLRISPILDVRGMWKGMLGGSKEIELILQQPTAEWEISGQLTVELDSGANIGPFRGTLDPRTRQLMIDSDSLHISFLGKLDAVGQMSGQAKRPLMRLDEPWSATKQ